jgi:hypothetical protein
MKVYRGNEGTSSLKLNLDPKWHPELVWTL